VTHTHSDVLWADTGAADPSLRAWKYPAGPRMGAIANLLAVLFRNQALRLEPVAKPLSDSCCKAGPSRHCWASQKVVPRPPLLAQLRTSFASANAIFRSCCNRRCSSKPCRRRACEIEAGAKSASSAIENRLSRATQNPSATGESLPYLPALPFPPPQRRRRIMPRPEKIKSPRLFRASMGESRGFRKGRHTHI
jgi:hypothetical protein